MTTTALPSIARWIMLRPQLTAIALVVVTGSPAIGCTALLNAQPGVSEQSGEAPSIVHEVTDQTAENATRTHSSRDDRLSVPLLNEVPNPTDLDRRVAIQFDPFARIPHSVAGTMIAQYRLPIENTDDYSYALVIYNPELRASCKVHSYDGAVHLIDPNGNVYRGSISGDNDLSLELTGTEEWPFSNRLIVPFMPSSAVEDLYMYNRDAIITVSHRTRIRHIRVGEETKEVSKITPGVEVVWRPATSVNPRVQAGTTQPEIPAIRYEIDAGGRLVAYNRIGEEPKVIDYRGDTPQHFPLPDPAHGGNWRLHRWQFIEGHNHEALFTAESIRAIVDAWGMQ